MTYDFVIQRIKEQREYINSLPPGRSEVKDSAKGVLEYFANIRTMMLESVGRDTNDKWYPIPVSIQEQLRMDEMQYGRSFVMLGNDGSFIRLDPTMVRMGQKNLNIYPVL
jgi:hypothetical protein